VQYVSDCRKYARLELFGTLPPERGMEQRIIVIVFATARALE
jgi:hypothetical protein